MATKILDSKVIRELQPATELWKLYRPEDAPFSFKARNLKDARQWQKKTGKALLECLGIGSMPRKTGTPKVIEKTDKGDYVREKILLQTSPHTVMPVYMLVPKRISGKAPAVVAFHGHGYGAKDIVGLWEDGNERGTPEGYHRDFAVEICRRGFIVAAPEISCFGERRTDFSYLNTTIGQWAPSTCVHTATLAFHLGISAVALRVRDSLCLLDYMEKRSGIDADRIGAMGISGGGMHTFFSTALDPRIKACVVSGYFCEFRHSIFGMNHCTCNYVPGLAKFGEIYDLAALIAPRPILVEAGNYDSIFPIDSVHRSVERTRKNYRIFGAENAVRTDYFEGRHQISGAKAYDFLVEQLG